jgi:hypothetical protein
VGSDTGTRAASVGRALSASSCAAGRRPELFIRSGVGRVATEGGVCRHASLRRQAARRPRRKAILVASGSRGKQRPPSRGNTSARRAAHPAVCLVTRCPAAANCGTGFFLLPRAELRQNRALAPGEQLTLVTLTCARSACRDRAPLFAPLDDPRASARSRRYCRYILDVSDAHPTHVTCVPYGEGIPLRGRASSESR